MKIYIVMGAAGNWEDYNDWVVKAFLDKNKAEEFKENAQKYASLLINNWNAMENLPSYDCRKNPYDPRWDSWESTTYEIVETELID